MSKSWQGGSTRAWRKLRAHVLLRDGYRCGLQLPGLCQGTATSVHHLDGVKAGLIVPPDRLVAACMPCNSAVGDPAATIFPTGGSPGHPRPYVRALSGADLAASGEVQARPDLIWSPEALSAYEWLQEFTEVPEDAAAPLWMTRPTEEAVGSYGAEAVEWVESSLKIRLRWWQRLAIVRQLEHREDGSLIWRTVVESCPRRAGKSVRIRSLALWRMAHADLIGEVQTVVHCGNDLPICREIQRGAWRWAEAEGWTVGRSNGKEVIESPDGSRWLVRSQDGVYGWDAGLAVVDEAWDVKPDTVSEGLEPAMLERIWAQLHVTSTAHRRATSLMKSKITEALTTDDGESLLMLWGAPPGADISDPEVWKAASPHWSEDRRRMITAKYAAALAGEADPAADDPNPMSGFTCQYLNIWPLRAVKEDRGEPAVSAEDWAALADDRPDGPPDSAAVEAWFGDGVSLALAWKVGDRAFVSVEDLPDLSEVPAALERVGYRRTVTIGASLLDDPAIQGVRTRKGMGRAGVAVAELQRLLSEDALRHDDGEHLTGQVLAARTMPGADGPRMVSNGGADALKAAVWAVAECRKVSPKVLLIAGRDTTTAS